MIGLYNPGKETGVKYKFEDKCMWACDATTCDGPRNPNTGQLLGGQQRCVPNVEHSEDLYLYSKWRNTTYTDLIEPLLKIDQKCKDLVSKEVPFDNVLFPRPADNKEKEAACQSGVHKGSYKGFSAAINAARQKEGTVKANTCEFVLQLCVGTPVIPFFIPIFPFIWGICVFFHTYTAKY